MNCKYISFLRVNLLANCCESYYEEFMSNDLNIEKYSLSTCVAIACTTKISYRHRIKGWKCTCYGVDQGLDKYCTRFLLKQLNHETLLPLVMLGPATATGYNRDNICHFGKIKPHKYVLSCANPLKQPTRSLKWAATQQIHLVFKEL